MDKKILAFTTQLLAALLLAGALHFAFLHVRKLPLSLNLLVLGYVVNFVLAVIIYIALKKFAERNQKNLGFLFLFGSVLKFAVFFIVFYPIFKQDGDMSRLEFFTFFAPYFVALIVETAAVSKLLKAMD